MVDEEFGGSIIEPRIELMNDGLVPDDTENSDDGGDGTDEEEDGDADEGFPGLKG